jgi:hypothetical protein
MLFSPCPTNASHITVSPHAKWVASVSTASSPEIALPGRRPRLLVAA